MAVDNSLRVGQTPAGPFTESSMSKTSPKDDISPSSRTEGSTPLEELMSQAEPSSENDTSEQHSSNGSLDEKSKAAAHDQGHDTSGDEPRSDDGGQMSKDKEEKDSETVERKAEEISERIMKYGHYLQMMGEQIVQCEKEIQNKSLKQNDGEKLTATKDKNAKRLPAIPKVGRVTWTDFKNRTAADTRYPAIEVLIGEARFYYQRRKEKKPRYSRTTYEYEVQEDAKEETLPSPRLVSIPYKEVPERVRINSIPVILVLSDITSENWATVPTVMVRPFKFLKHFETEIRQALKKLEWKWDCVEKTKENDSQSQLSESNGEKSGSMASEDAKQPSVFVDTGDHELDKLKETKKHPEQGKFDETMMNDSKETEIISEAGDLKSPDRIYSKKEGKVEPTAEELMDSFEALRDMRCLVQFIDTSLKPQWQYFDNAKYRRIQFADLWHIFKPGDDIFAPLGSQTETGSVTVPQQEQATGPGSLGPRKGHKRSQKVWRVVSITGGRPYLSPEDDKSVDTAPKHKQNSFWIGCYYIDYDGERFGPVQKIFKIKPFQGEKDICSLEVYPMKFAKDAIEVRNRLRTRGLCYKVV